MLLDSTTELHDSELVSRARQGDRSAFATLYERHSKSVYGYLRARVLDRAVARELTREAFFRAHDTIRRDDRASRFYAWIMEICRDLVREHGKKHRGRGRPWADLCLELDEQAPDQHTSDDVLTLIPVGMRRLSEPAAHVLELYYREGLSLDEIGRQVDQPPAVVKEILTGVRAEIQRYIDKHLGGGAG